MSSVCNHGFLSARHPKHELSCLLVDSFDDFMSQINEEDVINNAVDNGRSAIAGSMSPVIVSKNKRRKCFELNLVGQNEATLG